MQPLELLANVSGAFVEKCIKGLKLNTAIASGFVEKSLMMCTSLAPEIGYDQAAKVAKGAFASGQTVREYVLKHKLLDRKRLDGLLDARSMTEPQK